MISFYTTQISHHHRSHFQFLKDFNTKICSTKSKIVLVQFLISICLGPSLLMRTLLQRVASGGVCTVHPEFPYVLWFYPIPHHKRNLIGKFQNHPVNHRAPYGAVVEISMPTQWWLHQNSCIPCFAY